MRDLEYIYFESQQSFREWLEINHDKSQGVWLVFYKKHCKKNWINYQQALDEALCFGWIDSTKKRMDEDKYVQVFSPRRNISNWSDVNKKKVMDLMEQGRMTEAGLNKIDIYLERGKLDWELSTDTAKEKKQLVIPRYFQDILNEHPKALENFSNLAPSYKKHYVHWISDAKREHTRNKRIEESIKLLSENRKLGYK